VCVIAAGTALADSDDIEFVRALREKGYDDFAEMQIQRMRKSKDVPDDEKAEAALELADLYETRAKNETKRVRKEAALAKTTDELASFIATYPDHDEVTDIHYHRAMLLRDRGALIADLMQGERDAKAKKELLAKAAKVYDEARKEAGLAAEGYKGSVKKRPSSRRRRGKKKTASEAKIKMLDSLLLDPWITYSSAKLYEGTPNYNKTLSAAIQKFEAFASENKGTDRTLVAFRGAGLCFFRMKRYDDALKMYRKVIRTRPIPETDEIRQLAYYNQAECYNVRKKYPDAIKTVSLMLGEEWPDLWDDRHPVAMAAKLEEGKALVALGKQSLARAAALKKQKKSKKEIQAQEKEAEGRIKNAVANAQAVARAGGVWSSAATELLSGWLKLLKTAPKRTAQEVFTEAEALYKGGKFLPAVSVYREVITSADEDKHKQFLVESWKKLGACYFRLKRPFEAALCLGHVPRTFGAKTVRPDWAFISLQLFSQLYQQEKTGYSAMRYLDALQYFGRGYPKHEKAPQMQFLAAEISRDQEEYGEAATDYALITAVSQDYERAAYLAGFCNWLEFLRVYERDRGKAMVYAKRSEDNWARFLKWSEELPKIQPERVAKGVEWVAKTKVDLGELYVHEAVGKASQAVTVLDRFTKTYAQYPDLFGKQFYVKVRAYSELDQMPEAEKAFADMVKKTKAADQKSMAARLIARGYLSRWEEAKKKAAGSAKELGDKAARYFGMVLTVKPDQEFGDYVWVGDSMLKLGRYQMAADVLKKTIERFQATVSDQGEIHGVQRKLAEAHLALKDYPAALALVEGIVERNPEVLDFRKDLAVCYEKSGRHVDALKGWRKVAVMTNEGDPDWHLAKAKVANMHLALNNAKQAFDMLVLTLEFYPDLGAAKSPEAAKVYQSAIEKLPDDLKKQFTQVQAEAKKQAEAEEAAGAQE